MARKILVVVDLQLNFFFRYMKIVHAHYAIIRQFVCRVSLRIDPDDWNTFADELNKYIPGIGVLPVSIVFSLKRRWRANET